jgi:hypothetical protein
MSKQQCLPACKYVRIACSCSPSQINDFLTFFLLIAVIYYAKTHKTFEKKIQIFQLTKWCDFCLLSSVRKASLYKGLNVLLALKGSRAYWIRVLAGARECQAPGAPNICTNKHCQCILYACGFQLWSWHNDKYTKYPWKL